MKSEKRTPPGGKRRELLLPWIFPLAIGCLYILGFVLSPEKAADALHKSSMILMQVAGPIGFALVMMILLNRFLPSVMAVNYMGQGTGLKGILFSSLAGVLSMGPIYAWYPLFTTLREKGASSFHIANFIGCRSIKPVLLPVLVSCFGWLFTVHFLLCNFLSALLVAVVVHLVVSKGEQNSEEIV
ncbi:MAG: hypothetical protein GY702_19150 [Desulfobulbaceae bacterium]|nr:hypothetical protein [Desulfobulbaceae bacterium]